jgi:hypothetical protein
MFRETLAKTAEAEGLEVPDGIVVEGHRVLDEEQPSVELILPTGELVDLSDPASCAKALIAVREIESHARSIKAAIVDALAEEAKRSGDNVILLPGGDRVVVKRNYDIAWDAEALAEDLREAGMSEERISEIVVEEVSYTVKAVEANKAAKANPEYAKAVASARSEVDKRPTISLPRG